MKTALIAGASGLCGKSLLFAMLKRKEYSKVFILVRKELAIKDAKLTQLLFDYENEQDYQNIPQADEIFCCLGTTIKKAKSQAAFKKVDWEYPSKLAKVCADKKYKKFLLITAIGADKNSTFFYNRVKGETEEAIKTYPFESIFICRPSLLLGNRSEFRLGEKIGTFFGEAISVFLFGALKRYKAIDSITVANAMLALADGNETGIHIIESDKLQDLGRSVNQ
ncbi:MAG TPA: NAD(P)H-binding protein [Cytophagaceae bacterium]|jgi:uncharacterized protein YbjT (DUF2867 family)|nr:NAD(P)H-binding protein [Cytophagaceae bacterium]